VKLLHTCALKKLKQAKQEGIHSQARQMREEAPQEEASQE
jgi:hypothetical protein